MKYKRIEIFKHIHWREACEKAGVSPDAEVTLRYGWPTKNLIVYHGNVAIKLQGHEWIAHCFKRTYE